MSRYKYFIFLLVMYLIFSSSVSAVSCSYEQRAELNNEIVNVTANYEVLVRRELDDTPPDEILGTPAEENYYSETDYFQINILNLTENLYAVVTNNYDDQEMIFQYSDTTDGNIAFEWNHVMDKVQFTIEIYSSSNTECEDTLLRTIRLQLPRYNEYSEIAMCDKVPDYYLCQRYVTFDEIDFGTWEERVRNEIESSEETKTEVEDENPIINFILEHRTQIIIGVIIIVLIVGGTVVVIKIKRRRDEI